MGRVEPVFFQLIAERSGKQTAGTVAVVVGDEMGVAMQAVAEGVLLALELPL